MRTNENAAVLVNNGHERDALKGRINGIGQRTSEALCKLSIRRVEDLAQREPDELLETLHEQGYLKVLPGRIKIQGWIDEARREVQQANTERTPPEEKTEMTRNPKETPVSRWQQHAEFSVFIDCEIDEHGEQITDEHGEQVWQTRVYHNESGDTDELPIEAAPWVNWILERAELPDTARPVPAESEVSAPPAPVTPYDVQLKILNVQVSEIGPSPDVPEKKLVAEVRFQISGHEAKTLTAKRFPFRIEVHTVDLESGASNLIARERSQLQPKPLKSGQQKKLEFPVPKLGRHELHTIVLLLPPGEMMAYHRGPTIKVVP